MIDVVKARNNLFYFTKEVLGIELSSEQKRYIKEIMKGKNIKLKMFDGWKKLKGFEYVSKKKQIKGEK